MIQNISLAYPACSEIVLEAAKMKWGIVDCYAELQHLHNADFTAHALGGENG